MKMKKPSMHSALLSLLICVIADIASAGVGDICGLTAVNTAIVDNRLYFMGGNYSFATPTGISTYPSPNLYWLDIGQSFPVESSIPSALVQSKAIPSYEQGALASFNFDNVWMYGALWNTNQTLYPLYGAGGPTDVLSSYDASTAVWNNLNVKGGDFNNGTRIGGLWASTPQSLSFILGGLHTFDENGVYEPVPSMLRFDASDPAHPSWTKESLGYGSTGVQVPNLGNGAMVYVPAGKEGMLILFGGFNISSGWSTDISAWYISDMSQIGVYDIATHQWWWQTASGATPEPRAVTCTGVSVTEDNSAFHITMYGGVVSTQSYEDVFVLTLPSFTWINATSVSAITDGQRRYLNQTYASLSTTGEYMQRCSMYQNTELMVLGGKSLGWSAWPYDNVNTSTCAGHSPAVRVLDTSTFAWQKSLEVNPTYKVPQVIIDAIGGNESGGAIKREPDGGFADATLSSLMQLRVHPTSKPSSTPKPVPPNTHTNIAAIAGGVVAGVVVLAIILTIVYWLLKRRKDRQRREPMSELYVDPVSTMGLNQPAWSPDTSHVGSSTRWSEMPSQPSQPSHSPPMSDVGRYQ